MKPLIVFSDVTIDGFMAGPDNDLDFMVDDPQLEDELTGMLMSVADTIVWSQSVPRHGAHWTTADGDLAAWMNATPGRIDRLHDLSSKGVHADTSEFEVNQAVIQTYLLIGDILRLADGDSAVYAEQMSEGSE